MNKNDMIFIFIFIGVKMLPKVQLIFVYELLSVGIPKFNFKDR